MARRRMVATTGWAATVLALLAPVLFGAHVDGYSWRRQYISELGAQGAPDGALVSGLFVVIGLLVLAFVAAALPSVRRWRLAAVGLGGMAGVGVSYAVSGVARCEAGCPEPGTTTAQDVHNLAGFAGYGIALLGMVLFAVALRKVSTWRPVAVGGGVLALVAIAASSGTAAGVTDRSMWQRIVELCVFAWIASVAWRIATPEDTPPL